MGNRVLHKESLGLPLSHFLPRRAKEVSHQPHSGLTEVLVYSLRTHTVVRRLGALPLDDPKFGAEEASVGSDPGEDFCSAVDIQANSSFVAIVSAESSALPKPIGLTLPS